MQTDREMVLEVMPVGVEMTAAEVARRIFGMTSRNTSQVLKAVPRAYLEVKTYEGKRPYGYVKLRDPSPPPPVPAHVRKAVVAVFGVNGSGAEMRRVEVSLPREPWA